MSRKKLSRDALIQSLQSVLPEIQQKYGVERIAIFGSYAQGTARTDSDVDILVHLSRPLGFEFISLATQLEETLEKKVDLVTYESLQRNAAHPRRSRISREIERTLVYVPG